MSCLVDSSILTGVYRRWHGAINVARQWFAGLCSNKGNPYLLLMTLGLSLLFFSPKLFSQETRIKDLVSIRGVRSNQLMGMGLVVGLNQTGDKTRSLLTNRPLLDMVSRLGTKITNQDIASGSSAVVMVTAEMTPFSRNGDRIDARVSILGDAKSLAGGILVSTPLTAGDGSVYGFAQGPVVIGQALGVGAQTRTVATVPSGVTIEKEFLPTVDDNGTIILSLRTPDFTTNRRIVDGINQHLRGFFAKSVDIHGVEVQIPPLYEGRTVEFLSEIEGIRVVADQKSIVIINERTGTVVMGGDVLISPITVSHGELAISVGGKSGGGKSKDGKSIVNFAGTTVSKLVESMNAMGMKPADLVGIMQAIQASGSLQADLKFM